MAKDKSSARTDFVSTGSTQLNLAISGKTYAGFRKGTYNLFVGDSSSGKTFLTLTTLAEASVNPAFDDYQLVYDPAEAGAKMDFVRFFGQKMADRIVDATGAAFSDRPTASTTVEEFYYNLQRFFAAGPCIYILDSMDVLTTEDEQDFHEEKRKAHAAGKQKETGSYGTSKPKLNSTRLRAMMPLLIKTGSILVIITQTRDNIGFGAQFNPKTRGGGHALKFYADVELWTSRKETIKEKIAGKPRQLGIKSLVKVKKNRHTGTEAEAIVPIFHSFGIDDVGSCVEYLLEEGHWKKVGGRVKAVEFDFNGYEEELCKHIDSKGLKPRLRKIVAGVWHKIALKCKIERKSPYE